MGLGPIGTGILIKHVFILSFSMLLCTAAIGDESECAGSVSSILQCLDQKHDELDSQLNTLYKEVIRRFPFADLAGADKVRSKAEFTSAQREWIRFRDADCATTAMVNGGGDASKYESLDCLNRHTQQRIADLKRYIEYLPGEPLK